MKIAKSHSFDIDIAEKYGIKEALLINHFAFYISINKRNKRNFYDGRTWVYHTIEEICDYFPYITPDEMRTTLDRLCLGKSRKSKGEKEFEPVLMKGNYNKTSFDHTMWYAFVDEERLNSNNSNERALAQIERARAQISAGDLPDQAGLEPNTIPSTETSTKTTTNETGVVDFYSCLIKLELPDSDKRALMKFEESKVFMAVEWATHDKTKISTTLIQALIWYCKQEFPPSIPVDLEEKQDQKKIEFEKNRQVAKETQTEFEKLTKENPSRYVSAGENIITFRDFKKDINYQLPYVEKNFLHKLNNAKNQFNLAN